MRITSSTWTNRSKCPKNCEKMWFLRRFSLISLKPSTCWKLLIKTAYSGSHFDGIIAYLTLFYFWFTTTESRWQTFNYIHPITTKNILHFYCTIHENWAFSNERLQTYLYQTLMMTYNWLWKCGNAHTSPFDKKNPSSICIQYSVYLY